METMEKESLDELRKLLGMLVETSIELVVARQLAVDAQLAANDAMQDNLDASCAASTALVKYQLATRELEKALGVSRPSCLR